MKIKELITKLNKYDPEMDVLIYKEREILIDDFSVSEVRFTEGGDCRDAGAGIVIEIKK
jgi:hypothetical protein